MLKATNTTTSTVSANGTIPINLIKNTSKGLSLSNNAISISRLGIGNYKVDATFNITASTTTANIGLYANGTLIPETNVTITTTSGDEYQLVVSTLINVSALPLSNNIASLTFQSVSGLTLDVANISMIELH